MIKRFLRTYKLRKLVREGLPNPIVPALQFLVEGVLDERAQAVAKKVEAIRAQIAARGNERVDILYSPLPGSSGTEASADMRPAHGEVMQFTMAQVANTGKKQQWATALYLLAEASKAKVILELGSCAGISACYLASSPYCKVLHTIEGAPALARLAQESLNKVGSNGVVHAALFDEALDKLLPVIEPIGFAYIDGHHEKVATIHYWQRIAPKLAPGAMVVFDDISWSNDMRACWDHIVEQPKFTDAFDLGTIGVCIAGGQAKPRIWDLQGVVGRTPIGQPHGWKKAS
ncbi:MAG TPA: class I SAM-dependent methyltransferase [Burkholderiales bacterium]|nr:class I SAM-dependent methyltransferase [Burkholderiales bacterium]